MQHQPEVFLQSNGDSFADSPQFANDASVYFVNRWLRTSKQKSTCNSNSNKSLTDDARFQRSHIGNDIRQFRHSYELVRHTAGLANPCHAPERRSCWETHAREAVAGID